MPAEAICPRCQLKLRVPADYEGRSVKCPQCQQRFIVHLPSNPPAEPPPPPPSAVRYPPGEFDQLIMSVLDEEDNEADTADAHVE